MMVLDDPHSWVPAAVAAFKLKMPTATNRDIGTGEFDYQPYIILGKVIGPWTWNANLGYNFVTSPSDEPLKDQFIYDLSVQTNLTPDLTVFAEIFSNSSPASGEKEPLPKRSPPNTNSTNTSMSSPALVMTVMT